MANSDASIWFEQKSLKVVINKNSDVYSSGPENMGRTKLIYNKIDIGLNEPVPQCLRRILHEQISVLKTEEDKLLKIKAIEFLISTFSSRTMLVK